ARADEEPGGWAREWRAVPEREHQPQEERRARDAGEPAVDGGIRRREPRREQHPQRAGRGDESTGEACEPQPELEPRPDAGAWLWSGSRLQSTRQGRGA